MKKVAIISLSSIIAGWAIFARTAHLSWPATKVFDEVYFPVFANAFLHNRIIFDVHPPLGKFLIAVGIKFFGFNSFGWRIVPEIFGLLTPLLFIYWWYSWQKDKIGALIIGCYTALDGALIVYSRLGLMDGILLFFIFLTLTIAVKAKRQIWVAVALGLAVSIKWIGLGVLVPVVYLAWRRGKIWQLLSWLPLSVIIYLAIIYLGEVTGGAHNPLLATWTWNVQAMHYQLTLKATHPWSSPYWSWPLLIRPVLLYYQSTNNGVRLISVLGNPILWWSSGLAVVASAIYLIVKKPQNILDHPLSLLLIGCGSTLLPILT